MQEFHAKRLLKHADFLDTVLRKQFNIGFWGCDDSKCGTVACVLGWAGMMPAFRRAGLKTDLQDDTVIFTPMLRADIEYAKSRLGYHPRVVYMSLAGELFFGLTNEQSTHLYMPGAYQIHLESEVTFQEQPPKATPKMAAKRIRHLVMHHHPKLYGKYLARKRGAA